MPGVHSISGAIDRDNHEQLSAIANVCTANGCDLRNVGKRGDGRGNYTVRGV